MPVPLKILSYTLRRLRNSPGVTITVLLTLALGIGANTAMFTVDYASMIAPLPYPNPDQLVMVWSKIKGSTNYVSPDDFLEWRRLSTAFQALNAYSQESFNLATTDQPEFVRRFAHNRRLLPRYWEPGSTWAVTSCPRRSNRAVTTWSC